MEANSESRAFEQERMQHSDVEASVQDTVEPVRKMSQMRQLVMDYGTSQQAAQFFKTFADGTRLRLLQALSVREMCVTDLCHLLEMSQPAVSNHLRVLVAYQCHHWNGDGIFVYEWNADLVMDRAVCIFHPPRL